MKKLLPSIYVVSLVVIWVLPGFIIDYSRHPSFSRYFSSFISYFIVFASALLVGMVLFMLNIFLLRWEEYSIWRKYCIIIVAYTSTCIIFLFSFVYISTKVHVDYFGGDPEGSWFMLTFPSVFFYAITGPLFCLIYKFFHATYEHKKQPPSENPPS